MTASFGRILSPSLLEMFAPSKRLNVHPSLLPAYRGSAPIQHTISNGDKETGVCVIEMLKWKEGIDTGAIWGSSRVVRLLYNKIASTLTDVSSKPLHDGAMFPEVRNTLAHVGGRLLVSVLRDMRIGKVFNLILMFKQNQLIHGLLQAVSTPQAPVGLLPHAPAITPEDGIINFNTMSAESIVHRYRGISHQVCKV